MIKSIIFYLLSIALPSMVFAWGGYSNAPKHVQRAMRYGAETKIVFRVVDINGTPIKGARVSAGFYMNREYGKNPQCNGLTDTNGMFVAKAKSVGEVNYGARKKGYYESNGRIRFDGDVYKCGEVEDGKWLPYGDEITVVLKPIKNPTTLIGKLRTDVLIPTNNFTCGFDLEKRDWVAPHGKGAVTDFELTYCANKRNNNESYNITLTMRFVRPFDGAYIAEKDKWSEFETCYAANTNAIFKAQFNFFKCRSSKPKESEAFVIWEPQYMVLRTRSKVDEQGNFIGAHYSKINGDFYFGPARDAFGFIIIRPWFNPVFNDTNLESFEEFPYRARKDNPEIFKKTK